MTPDASSSPRMTDTSHDHADHNHADHDHADHDQEGHDHDHDAAYGDEVDMPDAVPGPVRARVDILAEVAERWSDADFAPRAKAVEATIAADNLFTEEATAFALNQLTATATPSALAAAVVGEERAAISSGSAPAVYIRHGASTPVDGLREVMVAVAAGCAVWCIVPDASPALVPAFLRSLREAGEAHMENESPEIGGDAHPVDASVIDALPDAVDARDVLLVPAGAEADDLRAAWETAGGAADRVIQRTRTMTVGIIDGSEPEEERHNLAEDALLHEGGSTASLKVLWAPDELTPDPMLQAMADFRGVFPAHDDTPGTLEMQRAFLEAQDASHAYAAGMQFLVSRGDPEPQRGAHLRWSEYTDLSEVAAWVEAHAPDIGAVAVRASLQPRLPDALQPAALRERGIDLIEPGYAHRRPLTTPRVRNLINALDV